ncbi:mediator of RNA polymerase II transcription subunit 20-like isoform X1 [Temnothorax nylanderi]|uniref:mediator of RNA polymerase II transcription subunit 20-like isoform X1 n=1 Tax=Temnothorax nylanderi TaxID=102681 RepID=UPI003A897C56
MGVTVLQQYPMIENRTGPQTIEFLTKRVVALGAVQVGQFLVDCETYMSVPQLELRREAEKMHVFVLCCVCICIAIMNPVFILHRPLPYAVIKKLIN